MFSRHCSVAHSSCIFSVSPEFFWGVSDPLSVVVQVKEKGKLKQEIAHLKGEIAQIGKDDNEQSQRFHFYEAKSWHFYKSTYLSVGCDFSMDLTTCDADYFGDITMRSLTYAEIHPAQCCAIRMYESRSEKPEITECSESVTKVGVGHRKARNVQNRAQVDRSRTGHGIFEVWEGSRRLYLNFSVHHSQT